MNSGCIPTKALVRVAELIHLSRRDNSHLGFTVGQVDIDFPAIIARKNRVVDDVVERLTKSLESTDNLTLLRDTASFIDANTINVGEQSYGGDNIIIATGSRPSRPLIPGVEEAGYLTSTSIMELPALPRKLVVIGAGPIGMEFAQMFHRFGSEVTVLFRGDRVLPHEDADIGVALTEYLRDEGLQMMPHATVRSVECVATSGSSRTVVIEAAGQTHRIPADAVLLAIGREPNNQALGIAAAGIGTSEDGWIRVDSAMRTNVDGIYAVGDAIGHSSGSQLYTHVAVNEGGVAARNALDGTSEVFDIHALPGAVFTEPEVARVGLSEAEARAQGFDSVTATYPFAKVGRARAMGETVGLFKAIGDRATGKILGCHIFGPNAGELIHIAATAMYTADRSAQSILDAIFIHPTLAEGVQSVFEELYTQTTARMAH